MITLRPYQRDAINAVSAAHKRGHAGVMLVVPTGGGKTIIFARVAAALAQAGASVLIVVPAIELLEQTRDKLRRLDVARHGVIAATYSRNPEPAALVQVAMVQTLRQRPRAMLRQPNYLIFDECHLAAAESFKIIRERYPHARRLGVTATPWRLDGAGFLDLATEIVVGPTVPELIESGSLVPFRTYSIPLTEFASKGRRGREFDRRAMADAYSKNALVGDVVDTYTERAAGRSAICFAASLDHSRALVERFVAAGIRAEHLDGETPAADRAAILARLESGATTVVCNFGVLCAGFDCPRVACVIVARATASKTLWIQMAGRGMRPAPGKVDCVICDHGGNAKRHGNLAHRHDYRLDGRTRAQADDAIDGGPAGVECPRCKLIVERGTAACPACEFDLTVAPAARAARTVPKTVDGELVLLSADARPATLDEVAAARRAKYARASKVEAAHSFAAAFAATAADAPAPRPVDRARAFAAAMGAK